MKRRKRKRRLKKWVVAVLLAVLALIVGVVVNLILSFNIAFMGKESINEGASEYKTKDVLIFYPGNKIGKQKAEEMSLTLEKNSIVDYNLTKAGDYYLVSYPDGTSYYIDENSNDLKIKDVSDEGKVIVSDYIRYSMKKAEIDEAYTYEFLVNTYYENIDLKEVDYRVDGTDLVVRLDDYDFDVYIPLKYMQIPCGINLGFENEEYIKPRYVSSNRKKICFTFDDGPDLSLTTSGQMVDQLYKFDSSATFFVLGSRLGQKQINFCKESVEKGIEYGSHTQSHTSLKKLSISDGIEEIMIPYHDLYDNEYGFGYKMSVYRPPYGNRNASLEEQIDLTAVLWNVDSEDWKYRKQYDHDECVEVICNKVIKDADENDVVLFHDIYQTSVDVACELVEYYIKEGYQVVSASELINSLGLSGVTHFSGK